MGSSESSLRSLRNSWGSLDCSKLFTSYSDQIFTLAKFQMSLFILKATEAWGPLAFSTGHNFDYMHYCCKRLATCSLPADVPWGSFVTHSFGEKWMRDERAPRDVCGEAKLRANGRNSSQHCWTNNVASCCLPVGSGVETDARTP